MTKQDYGAKPKIQGVNLEPLSTFYSDDGSFTELGRYSFSNLDGKLQVNLSILQPGALKGFHSHAVQTDFWTCWEPLLVILYDERIDSPTFNTTMRFILCNQRLEIPPGVLHSVKNFNNTPVALIYAVTNFFDPEDPDEIRHPWNMLGEEIWEMQKG
jgi:dTDP-4-dehydrorhamnose 3,5-epimerase-like enzyme